MGILREDLVVGIDIGVVSQSRNLEAIVCCIDLLGAFDGVFAEIIDGREAFTLVGTDFCSGKSDRSLHTRSFLNKEEDTCHNKDCKDTNDDDSCGVHQEYTICRISLTIV
jgi:hypothetical protein